MSALTDNQAVFKKWVENYSCALKIKEVFNDDESLKGFYSFMKDFQEWLHDSIHNKLSEYKHNKEYEKTIRVYCNYIKDKILPVCYAKIKYYNDKIQKNQDLHATLNKWIDLEDDFYALACYRNIKMTALYLERGKRDKLWKKTIHLFENFFDYCQKLVFNEEPIEIVRASYFPGAGKTYGANILCAYWFGYDEEMSILRITYSEDLCQTFIRQIAEIINSKEYRKIFPKFDRGILTSNGNNELYSKYSIAMGFQFKFSSVMNFYSSTRDGQTTGKRGKVLMIDDLTKGADEANDEKLHKRMENKYDTEWCSRADSSDQPVIALGTMWSNIDLLNVIRMRAMKNVENNIIPDAMYKYTEIGKSKNNRIKSVFISTPILDYITDESTCPERYTTKKMREKRDAMDESLWNAVYQQRPTPPNEFLFAYNKLNTYDEKSLPREIYNKSNVQCYAIIDPTRTGNDFFAMGIFKRYKLDETNWSKWYLLDCLFEQVATPDMVYDVCQKIMHHNVTRLAFESNIDVSLGLLIKNILKEFKASIPHIDSLYSSTHSKQTRIRNSAHGIRTEIIYPSIKLYSLNSPMGKGMQQFTTWSLSQKYGDHDDFPDMISMFVRTYCEKKNNNQTKALSRKTFGIK